MAAAASLAGLPGGGPGRLLTELTRANLLTEYRPGRFTAARPAAGVRRRTQRRHRSPSRTAGPPRPASRPLHRTPPTPPTPLLRPYSDPVDHLGRRPRPACILSDPADPRGGDGLVDRRAPGPARRAPARRRRRIRRAHLAAGLGPRHVPRPAGALARPCRDLPARPCSPPSASATRSRRRVAHRFLAGAHTVRQPATPTRTATSNRPSTCTSALATPTGEARTHHEPRLAVGPAGPSPGRRLDALAADPRPGRGRRPSPGPGRRAQRGRLVPCPARRAPRGAGVLRAGTRPPPAARRPRR